jgi:hypothetical protein
VLEHELGHVLGLSHSDAGAFAVMRETLPVAPAAEPLSETTLRSAAIVPWLRPAAPRAIGSGLVATLLRPAGVSRAKRVVVPHPKAHRGAAVRSRKLLA